MTATDELQHVPEPERDAYRCGLCERVAAALVDVDDANDAVSALLSVAAAYLRVAPAEERARRGAEAGLLLFTSVRDSLD